MKQKKVLIIMVSWNCKKLLEGCLNSIKKNTVYKNYSVLVIDNGSKDGSAELVEKKFRRVKLIKNKSNLGYTYANNQGFKRFKPDYYFLLEPDTIVIKNWLLKAVALAESDKRIGVVGCKGITLKEFEEKSFSLKEPRESLMVIGAMALIKKEVIENVGVFDADHFSPAYGEDADLCFRARDCGFKVIRAHNIPIIHYNAAIATPQIGCEKRFFLIQDHMIKTIVFNLSFLEALHFFPGIVADFFKSITKLSVHRFFKIYLKNFLSLKKLLQQRKKRKQKAIKVFKNLWENSVVLREFKDETYVEK